LKLRFWPPAILLISRHLIRHRQRSFTATGVTLNMIRQTRNRARVNHKVLMVEFGADWCSDCQNLAKMATSGTFPNRDRRKFCLCQRRRRRIQPKSRCRPLARRRCDSGNSRSRLLYVVEHRIRSHRWKHTDFERNPRFRGRFRAGTKVV